MTPAAYPPLGSHQPTVKAKLLTCQALSFPKGKSINDALGLTNKAVIEALGGLPAVKVHCSVLAEEAVKSAIGDYYKRKGIENELTRSLECDGCCGCDHHHDHGEDEE